MKKSELKVNQGYPVFMGIDVHKNKWSICLIHQGEIVHTASIQPDVKVLDKNLRFYKGCSIKSVYEAGFSGYHLHRKLTTMGIKNIVVSANKIPVVVGDRVKTDKRDSKKLASLLSQDMLNGIYVPTEELQGLRQYLRTRYQLVGKRRSTVNQIKGILLQFDINLDTVGLTKEDRRFIKSNYNNLPVPMQIAIDCQFRIFDSLTEEIKLLEQEAKKSYLKKPYSELYEIITSVPGVGAITGLGLLYEVGDWNRFNNGKQIASYMGLTPSEYSSGETVRRGRITGQGNAWLRGLLIEASWFLVAKDPIMKENFNRIFRNSGSKKKAIVATARKLICTIYSLVKRREKYRVSYSSTAEG